MRIFVLLLFSVCSCFAGPITGVVVGVHDGDTLTILTAEKIRVKVRLWGIDAPELGQAFGKGSKESLSALTFQKTVGVDVKGSDRYGRTIGVVYADAKNVNLLQVEAGFAWWYHEYAKKSVELEAAEKQARSSSLGLWADKSPVPPWDWRKNAKRK